MLLQLLPFVGAAVLVPSKFQTPTLVAAGQALAPGLVSAEAVALMEGVLNAMFRTLLKRRLVALLALALVGTATVFLLLWAFAEPGVYALVLVEGKEGDDLAVFRRKQVALLKGRHVLKSALETPEVRGLAIMTKEDPVNRLQKTLMATFLDDTGFLRISVGEGTEQERVVLTNAVTNAYLAFALNQERLSKRERLKTLEAMNAEINRRLEQKRQLINKRGGMALERSQSLQHQLDREDLAGFRKELRQMQLAKISVQARINYRKGGDGEKGDLAKLQEEVAVLAEQERLLKEVIKPLAGTVQELSDAETEVRAELAPMQLEISAAEQIAKRLAGELEVLQLEFLTATTAPVRLFQKAESSSLGK